MNVLSKATRLFSRNKRPELSRHTVKHDRVDEGVLREWTARAPRLAEEFAKAPQLEALGTHGLPISGDEPLDSSLWTDLMDDNFFSWFGFDEPRVLDEAEILPSRHVNRVLADKLSRSEEMRTTRPGTKNRPLESALATISAAQSLRESFQDELKEHAERASDMSELERTLETLEEQLAQMRADNQESADSHDAAEMKALTQQRQDVAGQLAKLEQQQGIEAPAIAGAAQQAVVKASQAAAETVEQIQSIPGVGIGTTPGAGASVSPDVLFDLAERWRSSDVLKKIAEMLGKLLPDMKTVRRTQRKHGIEEIVDIELGNDIPALLPAELAKLTHPIMRLDFYRRFHEAQLLQYERVSTEELKKGPMIVVVDESDSMSGAKIIWAKSTALALVMIASRENRPAALISFGSQGQLAAWEFPKGKAVDPVALTEAAEHFFKGGTDTYTGLQRAADIIKAEAPFHAADVVVVTDGEDHWTEDDEDLRDFLRRENVHIHGVTVGIGPTEYMLNLCEKTTAVHEFEGKNATTDRLASVVT